MVKHGLRRRAASKSHQTRAPGASRSGVTIMYHHALGVLSRASAGPFKGVTMVAYHALAGSPADLP